ncbi:hypothetical protein JMA_29610 [Jeotgalibacillus malaysiensis]|uniref:Lipoprotein n=1 Tax=Jeotgalibacillus malaysiensis TaxID=1508404 RepID=A0A0B5AUJ2_9BACL|nr:hypothetical protein [Jeotgalibacillus malaysiensis]AJD92278.1 hypothetical protein JMA_29610 [Jeotgalibacillus malaysiensis]
MKKTSLSLALVLLLAACGTTDNSSETTGTTDSSVEDSATEQVEETTEEATEETTEEASEETEAPEETGSEEEAGEAKDEAAEEEAAEEPSEEQTGLDLSAYQPEKGSIRVFVQDDFEIERETVDVKGDLVQEKITFGDIKSLKVYKWTAQEISTLYSEENPADEGSILDEFEAVDAPQDIQSAGTEESGWVLASESETLSLPYGELEEVVVFTQTLVSETTDQETVFTNYYAKGLGLVKEVIEVTGENGYSTVSELSEVK